MEIMQIRIIEISRIYPAALSTVGVEDRVKPAAFSLYEKSSFM